MGDFPVPWYAFVIAFLVIYLLATLHILREYQRRFGDLETALQMYAGALDEPTSAYSAKVLAEKARLDLLRFKARKSGQSV